MKRIIAASAAGVALTAFLAYQPVSGDTSGLSFTRVQPNAPSSATPETSAPSKAATSPLSTPAPVVTQKEGRTLSRELRSREDDGDTEYGEDSDDSDEDEDDEDGEDEYEHHDDDEYRED